jgi:eukaryotic-like serine/threonine-protein kinase
VRGSAPYLAPEQARGDPVDTRTDVYALGALLFELVTGRPPFTGDEPLGIVHQHLHDAPPDPRALAPVGDALAGAMLRALAKDPDQRYPDPRDLVAAARRGDATVVLPPPWELATMRAATSGPATEEVRTGASTNVAATRGPSAGDGPSRRRSLVALAAVAVVGALVAAAALLGTEDPDAPEVVAVSLPPSEPATETSPPPSPDPTPTPSPEPTSPSTVEEAGAAVRRTIEEQRRDGQLSTKAVTELEEQLRKVLEKDAEGEPEAAAKELQKLREILDELVAKREATAVAAETLATPLDDLDALLPDVDESGRGGNDREDDDD